MRPVRQLLSRCEQRLRGRCPSERRCLLNFLEPHCELEDMGSVSSARCRVNGYSTRRGADSLPWQPSRVDAHVTVLPRMLHWRLNRCIKT